MLRFMLNLLPCHLTHDSAARMRNAAMRRFLRNRIAQENTLENFMAELNNNRRTQPTIDTRKPVPSLPPRFIGVAGKSPLEYVLRGLRCEYAS